MSFKDRLILVACVVFTTALTVASCINPAKEHPHKANEFFGQSLYDEAIVEYTKSIELDMQSAMAFNNRGLAYHKKGEFDEAMADPTKAIELDTNLAKAYFNRGCA